MLSFELLKNHAGVLLCGDYHSLETLHRAVHTINDSSPVVHDKEGAFLGLAYDARKAFEGQRRVMRSDAHGPQQNVRYGVEILWPVLLVQTRMLRQSLAYIDNTKWHQAVAYNLEAVVEDALSQDFAAAAHELSELWRRIDSSLPWPEQKLASRGAIFSSWNKADRKKRLPGLLASFDPSYPMFYEQRVRSGETAWLSPNELDAWARAEWVDPKW